MTMSQFEPNPIVRRKKEVRKRARSMQITGAAGAGVAVLGLILGASGGFILLVCVITLLVVGYNGWKIRETINEVDEW